LALATFPKPSESKVKYIELVYLQEFTTMLIIVMEQAHLKKQVIRLSRPISQMEVEIAGNKVRNELVGLTIRDVIELDTRGYSPIEVAMLETTIEMLEQEDGHGYSSHYLDGLRNLLAQPEFEASDSIRSVVNGIEDGSLIDAILGEQPVGDTVRVVIGQEHNGSFLWPLSVVLSLYGIPGKAQGVLGAIGPTRMEYLSTIASVKLLSSIMSEQIETAQGIW
jgi:heat-inducible transcriptional repressor